MKKQLSIITLGLSLLVSVTGNAQNERKIIPCYTEEATEQALQNNPEARKRLEAAQAQMIKGVQEAKAGKTAAANVYTIPVVFHVLHQGGGPNLPDQTLINALDFVNKDLAKAHSDASLVAAPFSSLYINSDIKLMLAHKDPSGNCITGIVRHYDAKTKWSQGAAGSGSYWSYTWDPTKYLNIYIVSEIVPQGTVTGGGIIVGYTYKPGTWSTGDPHDAIVYRYDFLGTNLQNPQARSLTHEVGHWLSLPHTWGNTNNPGISCGDDGIGDTPPTKGNFGGCPNSLSGNTCNGGGTDNVQNIMNYSDCALNFTTDQTNAMRNVLLAGASGRPNLSSAGNLSFTDVSGSGVCAPISDLYAIGNNYTVCAGSSLNFTNAAYNGSVTGYLWSANNSAIVYSATASSTSIKFPTAGTSVVSLSVSNGLGSSVATRTVTIIDAGTPIASTLHVESFEAQGTPNGWVVTNPNGGSPTWQQNTFGAHDGTGSMYIEAFNPTNHKDYLQLPVVDMKGKDSIMLTFRYAYARHSSTHNDNFELQASTDCGGSWTTIYGKNAATMANGSGGVLSANSQLFVPTAAQWKYEVIDYLNYPNWFNLTAYDRVLLRFMFHEDPTFGYGNRFFLDHVNLRDPYYVSDVGVNELTKQLDLRMYPNPSTGLTRLKFTLSDVSNVSVDVTDIMGRSVLPVQQYKLEGGEHEILINKDGVLSAGIYFVNVGYEGTKMSRKFIIR